jgi:hypothetical protein
MQGRIDATRLFNTRLFQILKEKAGMHQLQWDKQVVVYNNTTLTDKTTGLEHILLHVKDAKDSEPQQPPIGYAIIGWHVDDGIGVACGVGWPTDPLTHRVIAYINGMIQTVYATTLTGWHGKKALGFLLQEDQKTETVSMTAPDAIKQLATDQLGDAVKIQPKHVMTKDFHDIPSGDVPAAGDPSRVQVLEEQAKCRHALGVYIWASNAYPQLVEPTNVLCSNMHTPHPSTSKCVKYMTMHMLNNLDNGNRYGCKDSFGLGLDDDENYSDPYGRTNKIMGLHWFSDASPTGRSSTGGVGMLAGGNVLSCSQRQHLSSPDSHTSEIVSAGTNFSLLVPLAGVLQELNILQGAKVPFYLDSLSSVFVSKSDTAIKKSAWLIRRADVLQDGVKHGDIRPMHISERDMAADPFTKYLTYPVWKRHMDYILNVTWPIYDYK